MPSRREDAAGRGEQQREERQTTHRQRQSVAVAATLPPAQVGPVGAVGTTGQLEQLPRLPATHTFQWDFNYMSLREQFHNRERLIVTTRPPILASPVLDRSEWLYSLLAPCFCLRGNDLPAYPLECTEMLTLGRRKFGPASFPEPKCTSAFGHLMWRIFCLRCSVAEQTYLLFREEEERGREPYRMCCEDFFGREGRMPRTFYYICLCDLFTCGCPCGYFYHGLGTAAFGWRLRYLVRCRYRLQGSSAGDFFTMLCCPLFAVDQQGLEMKMHDNLEIRDFRAVMV
ncbi:hypothetical protein TraAM80_02795 [Trypanosoma rangeli]|uniref:Uncharacterized protein n=1 Tax=Trypanosoma rangeli TaxID=5698 RepID=A0A3R7L5Y3_TRYRA|nr:uncharacterized protein TraAM80_02795 [Trypanosoma rangeli]RNF08289.1 hypothetical protein TraAM80_02795 [Trypanosoma rangeli]|eukprot:RNF08289.1 hypothetical protein TraAM80_02795 [Trypanosoma rangeli]